MSITPPITSILPNTLTAPDSLDLSEPCQPCEPCDSPGHEESDLGQEESMKQKIKESLQGHIKAQIASCVGDKVWPNLDMLMNSLETRITEDEALFQSEIDTLKKQVFFQGCSILILGISSLVTAYQIFLKK